MFYALKAAILLGCTNSNSNAYLIFGLKSQNWAVRGSDATVLDHWQWNSWCFGTLWSCERFQGMHTGCEWDWDHSGPFEGGSSHLLYHRIIKWVGLEETWKIIQFQLPCHGQGHLPLDQAAQSSIQPCLEWGWSPNCWHVRLPSVLHSPELYRKPGAWRNGRCLLFTEQSCRIKPHIT